MRKNHSIFLRFMASAALAAVLLTSCAGSATTYEKQMELGRKYLTEMNYAEAIAAFTEAIKLNPDDIEAYMARAEAYAALEKYDEATADYTAVIEKTDGQPYLQATAYIGRAGVGESTAALTDAESDYTAALALLEKDTDEQDADAVLTLKKDVLVKHAAVCVTLVLFAKAAADYDALEALGENVTAKRNELADLVKDSTGVDTDAENNGLTPDAADTVDADAPDTETPENPETADAADTKETAADSKQEQAASSKEEAASSKEEQPASSKEEAASSKQETQPAQQTGQKETYKVSNPYFSESSATVSYQVGTNTVYLRDVWDEPDAHSVWEYTYTLSQPLTSAEHPSKGSTVFHVPAGTTVTCKWSYTGPNADIYGSGGNEWTWGPVSSVSAVKYGEKTLDDIWGTSLTVQSGTIYALSGDDIGDHVPFPAIGFTAD